MLQQRELRGMSVRGRAVAALLRVFLSACFELAGRRGRAPRLPPVRVEAASVYL